MSDVEECQGGHDHEAKREPPPSPAMPSLASPYHTDVIIGVLHALEGPLL